MKEFLFFNLFLNENIVYNEDIQEKGENMKKIVDMMHDFILTYLHEDSIAVDFTLGQGNDLMFFANQYKIAHVYGFDIQKEAIAICEEKVAAAQKQEKVTFILDGHQHCKQYIKAFDIGMFNFGYLPQGDPTITTLLETSKVAVEEALSMLRKKGILVLVVYPGHDAGKEESKYFDTWCKTLSAHEFNVLYVRLSNHLHAPYGIIIERIKNKKIEEKE